jgi:hypothetical protein
MDKEFLIFQAPCAPSVVGLKIAEGTPQNKNPGASSMPFKHLFAAAALSGGLVFAGGVAAMPIDLNSTNFFAEGPVTFNADGSITIAESDTELPFLVNDPVGNVSGATPNPEVIVAGANQGLYFDYNFVEPAGNADLFSASLFDADTGDPISPALVDLTDPGSGTAFFDLSGLVGTTLGLELILDFDFFNDTDFTSTVTLSNLRIDPLPQGSAPAPGVPLLLGTGLLAIGLGRRGSRRTAQRPGA